MGEYPIPNFYRRLEILNTNCLTRRSNITLRFIPSLLWHCLAGSVSYVWLRIDPAQQNLIPCAYRLLWCTSHTSTNKKKKKKRRSYASKSLGKVLYTWTQLEKYKCLENNSVQTNKTFGLSFSVGGEESWVKLQNQTLKESLHYLKFCL